MCEAMSEYEYSSGSVGPQPPSSPNDDIQKGRPRVTTHNCPLVINYLNSVRPTATSGTMLSYTLGSSHVH